MFQYNTFRESAGTLTLRHGNDNRVEGNFFLGMNKNETGGGASGRCGITSDQRCTFHSHASPLAPSGSILRTAAVAAHRHEARVELRDDRDQVLLRGHHLADILEK